MLYPQFSSATIRPGALRRLLWLLVGAFFLAAPLEAQTQQLRANTNDEGWGPRQSNTSGGKLLWFEHDNVMNKDDVYFYNGTSASLVQAQGTLTGIGDIVFALGTGASAGHVIGAWRRETDFAWISVDGGTPVLVSATNPSNPAAPLNPEGAGIADGCLFLILQDATGAFPRKYVYKVNPSTGAATILTDPATFPVTGAADGAPRITTSGCKAAWRYFDGSGVIKLHFYDGASIHVIDSGDIDLPHMSGGRVVYAKTVGGISQVFLYDSNLPSPSPEPLTSYSDPNRFNSFVKTDGRHIAWLRQNFDNSNRQILLNGDVQLTNGGSKPADGSVFGDFPLQLQRGQLLWTDASAQLRYAHDGAVTTVNITPATSVLRPWLADGYVAFLGLSNDGGTDIEPFRFTGTAPSDAAQPSAPFLLSASPGDTQVALKWDRILGAGSYNLYYARSPGVTKDNYLTLPGGTKIAGVTPPYAVTGLPNGMAHYFVVTSVEAATEGPNSAEASATPRAPSCVRSSGGGCFTTVQAALSGASAGDVIRVAEGTYVGAPASSGSNGNFLIDKSITLEGGWDSTFTSRDPVARVTTLTPGNANFSVVDIEGQIGNPDAVAPTVDGFTITGALGGNHGGGIRIRDSNAVIRNCIVTGNRAYLLGGGIWVQRGAPRIENNRIESNGIIPGSGGLGGGVELEGTQASLTGNTIVTNTIQDVTGTGGGVSVDGGGLVRLTNNTITNNAAATQVGAATDKAYGGGVAINGATVALTGNLISFNSANSAFAFGFGGGFGSGGGLYIFNSASFTLTGNTISNNTAGYKYNVYLFGGGVLVDSSSGQLSKDVISDNSANGNVLFGNGAGIAATSSTLKINGAQILNNKTSINCEGYGGGLYAKSSTITIDATVVQNNCAATTPFYGMGGGLAFIDSPFTVTNSLIAGNRSFNNDTAVGGIFAGYNPNPTTPPPGCGSGTTANNSPGVLVNDTIANNKGQGINVGSNLTLANTIIMGQTTGVKLCGTPTVTAKYNDFYNNSVANVTGFTLDSTNIVINPQLTAGYYPTRDSPVIDAGDNTRVPAGITTDLAGAPRFVDDPTKPDTGVGPAPIVDMGAYEFQPGLGFYTVAPCRAIDTRNSNGPLGGPSLAAGTTRTFALPGQCGIPSGAKAVSVNVAVTAPTGLGHLRMYPADQALPLISVINFNAGQTRGNNAILPLSAAGELAVFCGLGGGTVELILDVNGYFQ